jgi:hypothetical protein
MVGVDLMRDAFKANICPLANKTGPLANKTFDKSRAGCDAAGPLQGLRSVHSESHPWRAHLFAGSMGSFKNLTSHRLNAFDRPSEALSLALFANYLLNLVNERAKANGLIP